MAYPSRFGPVTRWQIECLAAQYKPAETLRLSCQSCVKAALSWLTRVFSYSLTYEYLEGTGTRDGIGRTCATVC